MLWAPSALLPLQIFFLPLFALQAKFIRPKLASEKWSRCLGLQPSLWFLHSYAGGCEEESSREYKAAAPHVCTGVGHEPAAARPLQPVRLVWEPRLSQCSGLCLHLQVSASKAGLRVRGEMVEWRPLFTNDLFVTNEENFQWAGKSNHACCFAAPFPVFVSSF